MRHVVPAVAHEEIAGPVRISKGGQFPVVPCVYVARAGLLLRHTGLAEGKHFLTTGLLPSSHSVQLLPCRSVVVAHLPGPTRGARKGRAWGTTSMMRVNVFSRIRPARGRKTAVQAIQQRKKMRVIREVFWAQQRMPQASKQKDKMLGRRAEGTPARWRCCSTAPYTATAPPSDRPNSTTWREQGGTRQVMGLATMRPGARWGPPHAAQVQKHGLQSPPLLGRCLCGAARAPALPQHPAAGPAGRECGGRRKDSRLAGSWAAGGACSCGAGLQELTINNAQPPSTGHKSTPTTHTSVAALPLPTTHTSSACPTQHPPARWVSPRCGHSHGKRR